MTNRFADRAEAGRALADALRQVDLAPPVVVLALPRGGVLVAAQIARALQAPLDLVLVRKIGVPFQPELAVAAVAEGDPPVVVIDDAVRQACGLDRAYVHSRVPGEMQEIARRRRVYLADDVAPRRAGATLIVVDDGIATGSTVRAALQAVGRQGPRAVVLAVPVAAPDTLRSLQGEVDRIVCLRRPPGFEAVGDWYEDFHQLDDAEVVAALRDLRKTAAPPPVG